MYCKNEDDLELSLLSFHTFIYQACLIFAPLLRTALSFVLDGGEWLTLPLDSPLAYSVLCILEMEHVFSLTEQPSFLYLYFLIGDGVCDG